eukprot:scaffold10261_cov269-Chaetoceros_neogracile.AAC.10
MSRAGEVLSTIPLSTLSFGTLCVLMYMAQILFNLSLHQYTMNPRGVIFQHEFYRMITSSFCHGSLLHIGMNMMSYMALGKLLERKFGTLFMTFTVVNSIVLSSVIYMLIALATYAFGSEKLMNQHSLGFSGVLFHLLVLESKVRPNTSQSIFGMFHIPAKYYPWFMLVAIQFLMPNISFVGHLSGVLCGTLQSSGHLRYSMPTIKFLRITEESEHLRWVTSFPSFINTPATNDDFVMFTNTLGGGGAQSFTIPMYTFARNSIETVRFIIFGREGEEESAEQGVALNEGEWIVIPSPRIDPAQAELV